MVGSEVVRARLQSYSPGTCRFKTDMKQEVKVEEAAAGSHAGPDLSAAVGGS